MVFRSLKNLFAGGFLLLCLWSILATSRVDKSLEHGTFKVISDCIIPTLEQSVEVWDGAVISPSGVSFTTFGFPNLTVELGKDNSGTFSGFNRNCTMTYGSVHNGKSWLYSCYDDGAYTCTISLSD